MIGLLHGYELEGSGSNLWTREVVRALARLGETVHLVCQEPHPEEYDFVAEVWEHREAESERVLSRDVPYAGRCVLHRPELGEVLPVYVVNTENAKPRRIRAVELPDAVIEDYLARNVRAVERVVREHGVTALLANHAVFMSVVAERVGRVPFAIMPHGSAIEYVVRRDERIRRMASRAFASAARVYLISEEMRGRVCDVFADVPGLAAKLVRIDVGVDTRLFRPAARGERRGRIAELLDAFAEAPRGKRPEQTQEMARRLETVDWSGDLAPAAAALAGDYRQDRPDADLEVKLRAVDWEREAVLLFLGRLVWGKGPQSVLAALPDLLEARPATRLLLVGEGPVRELLEALVQAMSRGDRAAVESLAGWQQPLPGTGPPDFTEVRRFLARLARRGELDAWLARARYHLSPPPPDPASPVLFTGYLRHSLLRFLLPCCDLVLLTSTVREAAPLVFLEALACGVLPLAADFGGLASSLDAVAGDLPAEVVEVMRLSAEPDERVTDLAAKVPRALEVEARHQEDLRRVAVERYDWTRVAAALASDLASLIDR
jgi:glycosyltransferase involved in cell wall biosynthesis